MLIRCSNHICFCLKKILPSTHKSVKVHAAKIMFVILIEFNLNLDECHPKCSLLLNGFFLQEFNLICPLLGRIFSQSDKNSNKLTGGEASQVIYVSFIFNDRNAILEPTC